MAEFHRLCSIQDPLPDATWQEYNTAAEALARNECAAVVPFLDHLSYEDFRSVYEPAADTFLLLDALNYELRTAGIFGGRSDPVIVLEIGCGTGVPSVFVRNHWHDDSMAAVCARPPLVSFVTDVNPRSLEVARETARINHQNTRALPHFFESIRCDLASALLPRFAGMVSMLLFNPPYVPTSDDEVGTTGIEAAWAGGKDGRRVIDRAIQPIAQLLEDRTGVAYLVTVDDNQPNELAELFRQHGLEMRPFMRRRAWNEFLTIQKITWLK